MLNFLAETLQEKVSQSRKAKSARNGGMEACFKYYVGFYCFSCNEPSSWLF
jgi:hypothetical protein